MQASCKWLVVFETSLTAYAQVECKDDDEVQTNDHIDHCRRRKLVGECSSDLVCVNICSVEADYAGPELELDAEISQAGSKALWSRS